MVLFRQSRTMRNKWKARPLRVMLVKVDGPGLYKLRLNHAGSLKVRKCRKTIQSKKQACCREIKVIPRRPRRHSSPKNKSFARERKGVQGKQGVSGYPARFGPQGPQGAEGVRGNPGAQGIQGVQGVSGVPGTTGSQGIPGPPGAQGILGLQGLKGLQGVTGPQGIPGPQGPEGPQGIPGTIDISTVEVIPSSSRYFCIASESLNGTVILPVNQFTDDLGAAVLRFPDETSNSYNHLFINGMLQEGQLFTIDDQNLTLHLGNDTLWAGTPVILEHVALKLEVGSS